MSDARFEDGADLPLRLMAADAEDLQVLSALAQDAVFPVSEISWDRSARLFALLLNRVRWEDAPRDATERVQSVLTLSDVQAISSQGVDRSDTETVLSLLSIAFEPGEDGQGTVTLTLAGDGAIRVQVECLNVTLIDVTRPYLAPSGKTPSHPA